MTADVKQGKIVLHFGMPKTGTTSIQQSLFRHLSDARFHYVGLGESNANVAIGTGFKADPSRIPTHARAGTAPDRLRQMKEGVIERLGAALRAAGPKTAILSAEAISALKEPEFRDLHATAARHCATVTAAGYVRRPKDFLESFFQQAVKGGRERPFRMNSLYPNYRSRLEKLDAVLGREHAHIWLFDPASFPGGCVVRDFCSRLDIAFRPEDVIRTNEGLSRPALSLLYAYRRFGPGYGTGPGVIRENKLLVDRIRELPGPKIRLHSSLAAPVIEARRADIEWMEARLGASLAEDLAAHDEGAIRSEEDLLSFTPESLAWLAQALGEEHAGRWRPDTGVQEVAEGMHRLRMRLAAVDEKVQAHDRAAAPRQSIPAALGRWAAAIGRRLGK